MSQKGTVNKKDLVCSCGRSLSFLVSKFVARYPELCQLKSEDKELGCQTYVIEKSRVSIHLNSPQSAERRKAASELAKENGINTKC